MIKDYDFHDVFIVSDEEFCDKWGVSMEELNKQKKKRVFKEERDIVWEYVPAL